MNPIKSFLNIFKKSVVGLIMPTVGDKDFPNYSAVEYLKAYNRYPYSVISAIAEDVATIEFSLKQKTSNGEKVDVDEHDFLNLLSEPNQEMTQYDFIEAIQSYLEMIGESFAFGFRDKNGKGKIVELYTTRPDWVTIVFNKENTENENSGNTFPDKRNGQLIKGFIISPPGEKSYFFDRRDVLYFRYFNPLKPLRGYGTMQAAALAIDNDNMAAQWQKSFFKNSANPGSVLEYASNLTQEEIDRIKKDWMVKYTGATKAGEPIVLHGGMKFTKIGLSQNEMQFIESRKADRDEILGIFRTPKTAIGVSDDVNRANAEATDYVFARRVVKPRMRRITETLNKFLQQEYPGEGLVLSFKDPVPVDKVAQSAYLRNAVGAPYMTPNEARSESGLDSAGDAGDKIYMPFASNPVDVEKPSKKSIEKPQRSKIQSKKINLNIKDNLKIDLKIDRSIQNHLTKDDKNKREKLAKKFDNEFLAESAKLKRGIRGLFEAQEKRIIKKLKNQKSIKGMKTRDLATDIFDDTEEIRTFIDAFSPIMAELVDKYGQDALQMLGLDQKFETTEQVKKFIDTKVYKFASEVNDTTLNELKKQITEGLQNGESISQIGFIS